MDHELELISPILEILEIEVFNILYNPGNTGNRFFLFSHLLEILEICVFSYPGNAGGGRAAPLVMCSWLG